VGTDAQVAQALIEELPSDEPAIEVPPDEAVVEEEALEPLSPKVKPKARKRNAQAREAWRRKAPSRTPENVSATAPTSGLETTAVEGKELEPDEGIDWTVPADFPDEPGPMPPVDAPDPAPPNPGPTKKPAPPTGTPEAPPRNPIVIDEPPGS
jgi:hypothetical protein